MASKETNIFNSARIAASRMFKTALFRINTGRAWTGNKITRYPNNHPVHPGAVVIHDPRPFSTGTPAGYSDGTGWTPVEITPEMVGKTVAVYTAMEAKTPKGKPTKEQLDFIKAVQNAGGIAGIVRSPDDAVDIINNYLKF